MYPRAVDACEEQLRGTELVLGDLADVVAPGKLGIGQGCAEAVGAEAGPAALVEQADSAGIVEEWGPECGQRPVAHVERLARIEQVQPVHRNGLLHREGSRAQERGHQPRAGRGLQQVEQPSRVVAVRMGQPDPPHVGRVDDRTERVEESPVRQTQPGVNDHRFGGV
jgi:hypothetical protein